MAETVMLVRDDEREREKMMGEVEANEEGKAEREELGV
jgi:hypothetical protein